MEPVSSSSYYTIRHFAQDVAESLTLLFYSILGLVNDKWKPYANYYSDKFVQRHVTLDCFNENVIKTSANILHPAKQVPVPTLISPKPKKFLIDPPEKIEVDKGICTGMCLDYMRRFLSSDKPFDEAIDEVARKFEKGSTKKGYIYQLQMNSIKIAPNYVKDKCKANFKKDTIILDFEREIANGIENKIVEYFKSKEQETVTNEEIIAKHKEYSENEEVIDELFTEARKNIKKQMKLDIERKWRDKRHECLNLGFDCHTIEQGYLALNQFENLKDGDYMIRQISPSKGHRISLFKRNNRFVIFDPNHGTLSFDSPQKVFDFIDSTTKKMFKDEKVWISILNVIKKQTSKV